MNQNTLFDIQVRPRSRKTRSTKEADKLLRQTRANLINRGTEVAKKLAKLNGTVTSREVLTVMASEIPDHVRPLWVGRVFARSDFVWTGQYATYSDSERNIHERTVKVWRLKAA